jgi:hypothetical protein
MKKYDLTSCNIFLCKKSYGIEHKLINNKIGINVLYYIIK